MACASTVTATFSGKQIQHIQFCCGGQCPTGAPCCVQVSYNPQGGMRAWCGCGPEEPGECHIVVFRVAGAVTPEIVCAGVCTTGQKCTLQQKVQGNTIVFSCECQQG